MNAKQIALLRAAKERILAEPAQFIMGGFLSTEPHTVDIPRAIPNCGTAACIAGWVYSIQHGDGMPAVAQKRCDNAHTVEHQACLAIGITSAESLELFYIGDWPQHFEKRWRGTRDLLERAHIAAEVIEEFIAKHGEEAE